MDRDSKYFFIRYLEKKRLLFPRFFFISDRALLTILGQAADSRQLHAHLLSLFAGVSGLQFDTKHRDLIVSATSSHGETLQVTSPYSLTLPQNTAYDRTLQCISLLNFKAEVIQAYTDIAKTDLRYAIDQVEVFCL